MVGQRTAPGRALLCAAWAGALLAGCDAPPERPNIVLIVIDTLRADKLGAYGFSEDTSPAFDALARRGVLFRNVLAPSSWTRPSIAALLTGLHPRSLGIFHAYHDALGTPFTTLAEVLWAAGYRTLGATANPNINRAYQFDQGFDEYTDSHVLFPWMPAQPGAQWLIDAALPAGRDLYRGLLERIAADEHRPFYAQVNVMEVHEHLRMQHRPELYADVAGRQAYADLFADSEDATYLRAVRQATDEVVEFIEAVSALPGGRNTLFVVTSDHGEGLADHPHVRQAETHGFVLYESQLRVPLLFYHPGGELAAGRVVEERVRLVDVMPTLLELAHIQGPDGLHGRSLAPLAQGAGDVALPDVFFAETRFQGRNKLAAYTTSWKYIENREARTRLPARALHRVGVTEDGAHTDAAVGHPDIVAKLAAELRAWELEHPEAEPTRLSTSPSKRERQQLRELGYLN